MEPTIIEKGALALVGFSFFGDPFQASGGWTEENEIGRLWQRLMTYESKYAHRFPPRVNTAVYYEVHIEHPETPIKGHLEVFAGVEVSDVSQLPIELLLKILPATSYAVFTLSGAQISSDWPRMIYREWLPQSAYETAHPYLIEVYDGRFKGVNNLEESVMSVYIPVRRRSQE